MQVMSKKKVLMLTIDRIPGASRVIKQARALVHNGHKVHIFAQKYPDLAEIDEIDGVKMRRFECFSHLNDYTPGLDDLPFLQQSKAILERRYAHYVAAATLLKRFEAHLSLEYGRAFAITLVSKYFKEADKPSRLSKRLRYIWNRLRIARIRIDGKTYGAAVKLLARAKNSLDQTYVILYQKALSQLDLPEDVDVVHAHDIYCLPAAVWVATTLNIPLVYDAHEFEPAREISVGQESPELPRLIEADCLPFVSAMTTVGQHIAQMYSDTYAIASPTVIFNSPEGPMGIERSVADSLGVKGGVRAAVPLPNKSKLAVFTGGIQYKNRGMDKVLHALKLVPEVCLAVVGERLSQHDEWFLDMVRALGLSKRVFLLPPVPDRQVVDFIRSADVSIIPIQDVSLSYRFCMPNKLFEATFARLPVIVSDLPEMAAFVEKIGHGCIVDQTSPESIAAALRQICGARFDYILDEDKFHKVINDYTWASQQQKLNEIFEAL